MRVYKHKVTVTVLSTSRDLDDVLGANWNLEALAREMDDGELIGDIDTYCGEQLSTPGEIQRELEAMGNDGTFFEPAEDDQ